MWEYAAHGSIIYDKDKNLKNIIKIQLRKQAYTIPIRISRFWL
jgi:hypothetical protein